MGEGTMICDSFVVDCHKHRPWDYHFWQRGAFYEVNRQLYERIRREFGLEPKYVVCSMPAACSTAQARLLPYA